MENPLPSYSVSEKSPLVTPKTEKTRHTGRGYRADLQHSYTGNTKPYKTSGNNSISNGDIDVDGKKKDDKKQASGFKAFASLPGRKKYTLILITMATFLSGVAFSVLAPFYPTKAVQKGMNISTVGIVFGIFEVVIFMTAPLFGTYLVRIGPRFVFIAGIFLGGCCNVLFGTLEYCPSGTPFIVMSILIRSVEAVGFSGFMTSSFAIVSSEFKENIAFTFGILQTGSGLGYMLGPTIGGALYELGGFGLPFYFAGGMVLLNGMAVYRFLPSVEEMPAKRQGSMLTLLRSPMVIIPMCSVFLGVGGITTYDSTFAKRLEPMNLSVGMVGLLFGGMSAIYTIMSSIWGYITDTKDTQAPLIIVGHFLFGIGFFLIGHSILLPFLPYNLGPVVAGLVCIGVSFGCTLVPTMKCMVIGAVEMGFENNMDTNALVSGLFNSIQTLGGFVGPVGIGYLIQRYDYPVAYTVFGMCSILMAFVSLVFFSVRRLRKTRRAAFYKSTIDAESDGISNGEDFVNSGSIRIPFSRSRSMSITA